ncbi:glutaredoxin [bacterium]|jgi:glutaredoxin 3|nr:glutaredoxin [bacterium]
MSKDLALYYYDSCPFCQKVLRYMSAHDIEIPLRNTLASPQFREDLRAVGGKTQVPCLVIDGKALYESDDIISWLGNHYGH